MDNRPIEETKSERVGKKAGMYVSLFICIAALILGFWSAVNRTTKLAENSTGGSTAPATQAVREVEKRKTDVQATQESAAQLSTQPKTEEITVNPEASFFVMPVGGETIKGYSETELQYSVTYKDWRLHCGIDIAADKGTEVHAAGNGRVTKVYEDELLGNVVVIDHGNDITAYYCGLNSPLVKEDQVIEVGTPIGGIGELPSESVEAVHLHFAVKVKDQWADPIKTLKITDY